jgi:hypothetical protein
MECMQTYQQEHPEADFPLLHHTEETLLYRFQALLYAPLFGIGKLSEYDIREHALETVIGQGYQSSTLNQLLGQLDHVNAGEAFRPALLPAQDDSGSPDDAGDAGATAGEARVSIDGHMLRFWSRMSMHKGKITMLGRIMAGSQAVIAHHQEGQAIFVAYQPPDIRMPRFILAYCQQIVAATGLKVFVSDREVNSGGLAQAFHDAQVGLISMLDSNQYHGLSSWQTTQIGELADGSPVYEGRWATPRPDAPRHFVLGETGERVLAYWGTPTVKEFLDPVQWPDVYRQRTALQELRFKDMKAYEALDVNFGVTKMWGPDRHQEREREKLTEARDKNAAHVTKTEAVLKEQAAKVEESRGKGHPTRLEPRQRRFTELEQEVEPAAAKRDQAQTQLDTVGLAKQRADRDYRKHLVMTIRTLLLDNALQTFLALLLALMPEPISLECLLKLVFERSGIRVETEREYIYWINTAGLSVGYQKILAQIVAALCKMNLRCRGKPLRVRLKGTPP